MKNILVTGADGFIGSHLVELLLHRGYKVRATSLYNSFNHWGWLEDVPLHVNLEIVPGDIRDSKFCQEIVGGMDAILHLAALIAIPYSYKSPRSYVDTNISGTLNICEAGLNDKRIKRMIHVSTSEVYGSALYVPIDESHPLQPQSPYSASKIAADHLALSYFHSFGLPVTIARPFNTFGPRQSARAVIPNIISQIASGQKKIQLGDISTSRDFNFVSNTCDGFLALLESSSNVEGKAFNIGSGTEISIQQLFELIAKLMKSDAQVSRDENRIRPAQSEVVRLLANFERIKTIAEYVPRFSLESGLEKTIEWFLRPDNLKKYKSGIYNL